MKTSLPARAVLALLALSLPTGCAVVGLVAAVNPVLTLGAGALLIGLDQARPGGGAAAPGDGLAPVPEVAALTTALNLTPAQARQIIPLLAEAKQARQSVLAARAKFAVLNSSLSMEVAAGLTAPQQRQFAQLLADEGGVSDDQAGGSARAARGTANEVGQWVPDRRL